MMKMIVVEARRSSSANRWMADVVPSVTIQRDGQARSSLIRTDPYRETTNPRTRFGPAIAVLDRTRRQGGRAFDWHNSVSATGSEGRHLGQLIKKRLAGREVILPEHSGRLALLLRKTQTRPIVLDRKDSWPIAALCRLSRDVIASYLNGKRT